MTGRQLVALLVLALACQACAAKVEPGTTTTRTVTGAAVCGNGVIEPGEVCDDGNTTGGDACSADCKHAFVQCAGAWIEAATPCVPAPRCGDGNLDPGEDCDDGNTLDGDTCPANCKFPPAAVCGNGVVEAGEACDDGNTRNGDYCSADCRFVTGRCGDSVIQANEVCDDGNTVGGDYCSADCKTVTGSCGDGVKQANEACDDGNRRNGDYCSADCQTVTGRCGDGILQANEGCDDGNTLSGDLCPSNCSGWDLSACEQLYDPKICPTPTDRFLSYGARDNTGCMVRIDGTALCQGGNLFGGCGDGPSDVLGHAAALPVLLAYPFHQISVPSSVTCGLAVDGSLWCWGSNAKRGLGQGDAPPPDLCNVPGAPGSSQYAPQNVPCSTTPLRVGGRSDWKKVVVAGELVCALSTGGELWCWGSHQPNLNEPGLTTFLPEPTRIAQGTSWTDMRLTADGVVNRLYVRDDAGRLWRWRSYYAGTPLALGDKLSGPPELVTGLTGVVSHCVNSESAVAANANGTWQVTPGAAPKLIAATPVFKEVACARASNNGTSACGLTAGGQVYCWGDNSVKQLADGTTTSRTTPVLAHGGELFAGFGEASHLCVRKANGETRCLTNGAYVRVREQ
jgi:cysteine-rich repeat protein